MQIELVSKTNNNNKKKTLDDFDVLYSQKKTSEKQWQKKKESKCFVFFSELFSFRFFLSFFLCLLVFVIMIWLVCVVVRTTVTKGERERGIHTTTIKRIETMYTMSKLQAINQFHSFNSKPIQSYSFIR